MDGEDVMTFKDKCQLVKIYNAIDDAMGDTDPDCADMTDDEIRQEEPLLWAGMNLAKMIGPGPWDKFTHHPSRGQAIERGDG